MAFAAAFAAYGRWRIAAAGLLLACGALFDGVGLLMLVPVLGIAMAPDSTAQAPPGLARVMHQLDHLEPASRLPALLLAVVALAVIRGLVLSMRDRVLGRLQVEFVESIRMDLVERLASADWQRIARLNHAAVVQALSVEIYQIGIVANSLVLAVVSAVLLMGNCMLALLLAPLAGAAALLCGAIGLLAGHGFRRSGRTLGRHVTRAHFDLTESALQFLTGLKFAAAQGQIGAFVNDHRSLSQRVVNGRFELMRLQWRLREGTAVLAVLAGSGMLFVGVTVFHLAPAVLITLLLVLSRMLGPAQAMQQAMQQVEQNLPAFGAVRSLASGLDSAGSPRRRTCSSPGPTGNAAVELTGVTLRHGEEAPLMYKVDLHIPKGAFVGVSGASGCGKSSFLDLLCGLIPPEAGTIRAFGHDLADSSQLAAHRRRLAYAAAESPLIDGTVRQNLGWMAGGASEADMWHALRQAEAEDMVRQLEHGLDSRVGEQGSLLSAGERQRLALARALLRRPALLLLDEATNAIDMACEERILRNLADLTPDLTIILVTHRPESLRWCDQVLRFPGPRQERPAARD